ncbi:hypothetical protein [Streptomyces lavendulae]|uniref:hypothetical protein n=1 Tax=Streptomyces lavendulae TaxID=1914 RepID=UPI0024A1BFAF|nr:hypothetical protein Sros01_14850 [Streptomyces roseochromogenus]
MTHPDVWEGDPLRDEPPEEPRLTVVPTRPDGLLPEDFWSARPVLKHIRGYAHAAGCSGDVLMHSCLARLSGMLPHNIQASSGIGGRASLNLFVATVGGPGAGKSTGASLNRGLLPSKDPEFRDGLPVGSGEGIAEAFMGTVEEETGEVRRSRGGAETPVMRRVRRQVRHNAFFYIDEGQILAKLGERSGSTLGETLRRAAVGETLGQTNASEERTRYIEAGTYSLGLLIGFQPSTALPVLADSSTGTPQRFLWGWAEDPAIPDLPPAMPGPLPDLDCLRSRWDPLDITFPQRVREMLWRERVLRNRGELHVPELDGHAGLIKVKVSALLALLDGRYVVTEADWELAEVMWDASCAVRDSLLARAHREAEAAKEQQEEAKLKAELRAHQAKNDDDDTVQRIAIRAREFARKGSGQTFGAFRKSLASRDRPHAVRAVDRAEAEGWVFMEDGCLCFKT